MDRIAGDNWSGRLLFMVVGGHSPTTSGGSESLYTFADYLSPEQRSMQLG
jgi:hypothetical protein